MAKSSAKTRVLDFFRINPGTVLDLTTAAKTSEFESEARYLTFVQNAQLVALRLVRAGQLIRQLRPSVDAAGLVTEMWHYEVPEVPVDAIGTPTRRDEEVSRLKAICSALTQERDSLLEMLDEVTAPQREEITLAPN